MLATSIGAGPGEALAALVNDVLSDCCFLPFDALLGRAGADRFIELSNYFRNSKKCC